MVRLVKVHRGDDVGKGNRCNHNVRAIRRVRGNRKAADLSESYTFRQDGSEYTTTLVIKQKDLASEAR